MRTKQLVMGTILILALLTLTGCSEVSQEEQTTTESTTTTVNNEVVKEEVLVHEDWDCTTTIEPKDEMNIDMTTTICVKGNLAKISTTVITPEQDDFSKKIMQQMLSATCALEGSKNEEGKEITEVRINLNGEQLC